MAEAFVRESQALDFARVNRDFLPFLPSVPCRVLDAGRGAGQNAAALARLGHAVVAVEPLGAFLDAARRTLPITWRDDSLPLLRTLEAASGRFDFILVDGVWHHLDEAERVDGMARLAALLDSGGVCAISLRHGPAGAGTHVFPTDGNQTAILANQCGLQVALCVRNQPSIMPNKLGVTWTRIALTKP